MRRGSKGVGEKERDGKAERGRERGGAGRERKERKKDGAEKLTSKQTDREIERGGIKINKYIDN